MKMDVGMHRAKNRGNKEIPLAIQSRIATSTIMDNPLPELSREGLRMIVLVPVSLMVLHTYQPTKIHLLASIIFCLK